METDGGRQVRSNCDKGPKSEQIEDRHHYLIDVAVEKDLLTESEPRQRCRLIPSLTTWRSTDRVKELWDNQNMGNIDTERNLMERTTMELA